MDKAGRQLPADPAAEPPGLIVVVDTQPPEIEVRPLPASSGQVYLQVRLLDANPDYKTARAEYDAQGTWRRLELLADTPGVFLVPDKTILEGRLRVFGSDLAGNTATGEINLGPPKRASSELPALPEAATEKPVPLPTLSLPLVDQTTTVAKAVPPLALPGDIVQASANMTAASIPSTPVPAPAFAKDVPLVNARRCRMDFHIEQGTSSVARVEVWITPDGGRTWQSKGESRDAQGPAVVEFPGDGVYGYMFVVKSATGNGDPPMTGDAPEGWIEVDTTKPVAEFLNVALENSALTIAWVAHDKNLGPEPVALYCDDPKQRALATDCGTTRQHGKLPLGPGEQPGCAGLLCALRLSTGPAT